MSRWLGAVLLLVILTGCSITPRIFQPTDPIAPDRVTHQAWDRIVQAHVRDGQVDYPAIQARRHARWLSVRALNRIDPTRLPSRQDQLAFWINAYNAFAVKGIFDNYSPVTLWGRYRYFIGRDYRVGGATINLYDLERQVLIEQFHEPVDALCHCVRVSLLSETAALGLSI